jgi:hypothetical protein
MRREFIGHESWWMNVEEVRIELEHPQADDLAPSIYTQEGRFTRTEQ